jgi:hypothetical protein
VNVPDYLRSIWTFGPRAILKRPVWRESLIYALDKELKRGNLDQAGMGRVLAETVRFQWRF